jgi:hypothetical protein
MLLNYSELWKTVTAVSWYTHSVSARDILRKKYTHLDVSSVYWNVHFFHLRSEKGIADFYWNTYRLRQLKKLSRYRPGQALGVSRGWGSRISRQSPHEGSKVVSPTHRPSLPQKGFLVLISVRGWVDPRATMRPVGLSHWNIPVTPSGIEPATFRLVAQCLIQLRDRVPRISWRALI